MRDRDILPLVERTLDREEPRLWYYALMDYGVWLKKVGPNPNRRSAHYTRQSPFVGSDRQVRGLILKILLEHPSLTLAELAERVGQKRARTRAILGQLMEEGFLNRLGESFLIASGKGKRQ